jgi:hypothetical protein
MPSETNDRNLRAEVEKMIKSLPEVDAIEVETHQVDGHPVQILALDYNGFHLLLRIKPGIQIEWRDAADEPSTDPELEGTGLSRPGLVHRS